MKAGATTTCPNCRRLQAQLDDLRAQLDDLKAALARQQEQLAAICRPGSVMDRKSFAEEQDKGRE